MSYSSAALATFDNVLATLDHLAARAQDSGRSDALLGEARLAEDMFPLEAQFRIAINQVGMALHRIWGVEAVSEDAPLASFEAVRGALASARARVAAAGEGVAAAADAVVDMTLPNGLRFVMQAHEYVRDWTLPNLYFHATTAYGLLRRDGLALGKVDFLGFLGRYARPAEG